MTNERPPRGARRRKWLLWSALFLAGALAGASPFAALWFGEWSEDRRRETVEDASREFLLALTNFSADSIERDVAEIRSHAIGEFADEVETTFGPERIEAIRSGGAASTGEVRSVFVESLEEDVAAVFAVVDETVTNSSSPAPRSEVLRIEIGLIETTDGWKVNRVEILQSPPAEQAR